MFCLLSLDSSSISLYSEHMRTANKMGDQRGGLQVNWKNKKIWICLSLLSQLFLKKACMLDVLFHQYVQHKIFWCHFANSSKLLKNHFVNELDLTSFKFSATKWFFKSLEELAKCHQKIACGHTDESKCLAYRHILKTVVKVVEEKFHFLCFLELDSSSSVYMQSAALILPE